MDAIVASNDQAVAKKIQGQLMELGVECPATHLLSHDAARTAFGSPDHSLSSVLFFFSPTFSPTEVAKLKQICQAGGHRVKAIAVGPILSTHVILEVIRSGV